MPLFEVNCLPSTRPSSCFPPAWDELQKKFDGEKCPEENVVVRKARAKCPERPEPTYLTIPGHEMCLGTYRPNRACIHICIPMTKPSACNESDWEQLLEIFVGKVCSE